MGARASAREAAVGLAVGLGSLLWIALVATDGGGRWPWAAFVIAAAAPFLLLPAPPLRDRVGALVRGRPGRVIAVLAACAVYGTVLSVASGASRWYSILLWPVTVGAATLATGIGEEGEPSPVRLLLIALPVWMLAGVWDARLQVRVPGTIDLGLAYFTALDVALFLLLAVRPLRTLELGLALSWRELAAAVAAVLVLLVAALPVGYVVGFLRYNTRWYGLAYASGRLVGLILFVGLPEELLFRGILQEALTRLWGARNGWLAASLLFGLTHIVKHMPPLNWRYALLATLAGLAYGWVYRRTGRIAAAALTHGLVDWLWGTFLLVP